MLSNLTFCLLPPGPKREQRQMVKTVKSLGNEIADQQDGKLTRAEAVTLFRKDDPALLNPFLTGDVVLCLLAGKPKIKQLKTACKGAYFTTSPAFRPLLPKRTSKWIGSAAS